MARDTKKRPVVTPPATEPTAPKTVAKPPETKDLTNRLKEAERLYPEEKVLVCECGSDKCPIGPHHWERRR